MNNATVLRTESNGVEYFTIVATGESGMSQTGLARACGVSQPSLSELVAKLNPTGKTSSKTSKPSTNKGLNPTGKTSSKTSKPAAAKGFNPKTKAPSEWLEPFMGKNVNLSANYEKNGGAVKVYTAEFCAATIKHYAYSGSKTAQQFDSGLGVIGLTSYIQSQAGWLPEQFKAAPEAHKKLNEFLSLASEWDRGVMLVVDEEGYEVDMSDSWTFFDEVVFAGFSVDEFIKFEDETRQLGLRSQPKSEQIKLFFERNPDIQERQQPYTDKVQKMLKQVKNPKLFYSAYFEEYGCEPGDFYLQLMRDAIETRIAAKVAS
jgi:lysophospholipase L1-like esterase